MNVSSNFFKAVCDNESTETIETRADESAYVLLARPNFENVFNEAWHGTKKLSENVRR